MNLIIMTQSFSPASLAVFAGLTLLSVLAVTVAIYKFTQFRRMGVGRHDTAEEALDDWLANRPEDAARKAQGAQLALARVLAAVLAGLHARPDDDTLGAELGKQAAMAELAALGSHMRLLEAVVQGAPMLGLLGTVVGMIDAFGAMSANQGPSASHALAGGILTALTTTALGLVIALITYFIATWLESRIESERQAMEFTISAAVHGRAAGDTMARN